MEGYGVYGLITLLVATAEAGVIAGVRAISRARRRRAANRAAPLTAAQLAAQTPGQAPDARPREITGKAVASASGGLVAPLSGAPCVWYAVTVKERFQAWRPGPLGPIQVERHLPLATHTSGVLELKDETGGVHIDPRGAELMLGQPALAEFESVSAAQAPDSHTARVAKLISAPVQGRHRAMTLGFVIEEVVVREGDQLHVIGSLRHDLGEFVVGKRGARPFVISRGSMMPTVGPATGPLAR